MDWVKINFDGHVLLASAKNIGQASITIGECLALPMPSIMVGIRFSWRETLNSLWIASTRRFLFLGVL